MDINPELGYENMKTVASIKDDDIRADAQKALLQGDTVDMVKDRLKMPTEPESLDKLLNERKKIAQSIERLAIKLAEVEHQIENYQREFEEQHEN